jgi:hypothetical protein
MASQAFRQIPAVNAQPAALARILAPLKHDLQVLMGSLGNLRALTTADLANGTVLGKDALTDVNQAIGNIEQALHRIDTMGYVPPADGIPESDLDPALAHKIERVQTFIYEQTQAAATWRIAHNLGRYPSVDVVDSAEQRVIGMVSYGDANTVVLTFSSPFAGTAYLN